MEGKQNRFGARGWGVSAIATATWCALVLSAAGGVSGCGGSDNTMPGQTNTTVPPPPPDMEPPDSPPEQQAALVIFDDSKVHNVSLWMSAEDWKSILEDTRGDELRKATISIDGVAMTNVGVR